MFVTSRDFEEHRQQVHVATTIESMVAPTVNDAVELAQTMRETA
jgi:hypothetical protein